MGVSFFCIMNRGYIYYAFLSSSSNEYPENFREQMQNL